VRSPRSAARLARWPGEIAIGDVCSAGDMARAVQGCDAVVHCAVGTAWPPDAARKVTIEGTRTVAEAARAAGVRRFVHISTLFVHRRDVDGEITEATPLEPPARDDYGQAKLAAERALADVARGGLSTIVLRPARIYGPFSKTFTIRPLQAISERRFAIAGDSSVPANMVYVDNVVEAIARALEAPDGHSGAAFLVSDPEQVSLGEFYDFFGREAGVTIDTVPEPETLNAPATGLGRRWMSAVRTIATSPEFRGIVRRIIETDPIGALPRKLWNRSPEFQASMLRRFGSSPAVVYRPGAAGGVERLVYNGERARVSVGKLERDLGFTALVRRDRAMALTLDWARHARLLP
jgi:nucleoside-diphosphate-sugar epimerase